MSQTPESQFAETRSPIATKISKYELEGLLSGRLYLPELSKIGISDVTYNVRLNKAYGRSNAGNLADFLKLGESRFNLRDYGRVSEQKLEFDLVAYLIRVGLSDAIHKISEVVSVTNHNLASTSTELTPENQLAETRSPIATNISQSELEGLLSGRLYLPELSEIEISDVTDDVRLNNAYVRSSVGNLADFLKLGESRFNLRGYGRVSEQKLKYALDAYFVRVGLSDAIHKISEVVSVTNHNLASTSTELHSILDSSIPEKLVSESLWKIYFDRIIKLGFGDERIFFVCQEIDENWPAGKGWQDKVFSDFFGKSLSELKSERNFGKVKLSSLIKAVVYLLSDGRKTLKNMTPKNRLIWLNEKAHLSTSEQEVLNRRLIGDTLEEIGCSLNVSRERIRQIQKGILFRFRSTIGLQICSEYLDQNKKAIWNKIAKGKLYLSKAVSLSIENIELDEYDRFALFVHAGENVKGERFSEMVAGFFNSRFKQAGEYWFDLPYEESDVSAVISLLQAKVSLIATPVAVEEVISCFRNISHELLMTALQMVGNASLYCGYIVNGRLTQRKRRTIGAHIVLNDLGKSSSIVSTSALSKAYRVVFGFDQCSDRDIEMVMVDSPHLFFRIGQEGWISCGTSGESCSGFIVSNTLVEEDDELVGGESSERVRQIVESLKEIGISNVSELSAHLLKMGVSIPSTSLTPVLSKYEPFVRFAPGYFGLKKHLSDAEEMAKARAKLTNGSLSFRNSDMQLRSYVFARYAGEARDVYPLWGKELETLWAELLLDNDNDELVESFWNIVIPHEIARDAVSLKRYEDRRLHCEYRLNSGFPSIGHEERVDIDELLSSLIYLRQTGRISCARSNILMGRRIDGQYSISLLATLVLLGTIRPETDWRRIHIKHGDPDLFICRLKDAYSRNQQITWSTGLGSILLPIISSNIESVREGWIGKISRDALRRHFCLGNTAELDRPRDKYAPCIGRDDIGSIQI